MSRPNWHTYFMNLCREAATRSPDPDTKLGCILVSPEHEVLAMGYNGLPAGVEHKIERLQRPAKYKWMTHAEANAVAIAAKRGTALAGATAYVPLFPCASCAGLLCAAGVRHVVVDAAYNRAYREKRGDYWDEDFNAAAEKFAECNVEVDFYGLGDARELELASRAAARLAANTGWRH